MIKSMKIKFAAMLFICLSTYFFSCSDEEESFSLAGSTWVYAVPNTGEVEKFVFMGADSGQRIYSYGNGEGDTTDISYVYTNPNIVISSSKYLANGTIQGNVMTLHPGKPFVRLD